MKDQNWNVQEGHSELSESRIHSFEFSICTQAIGAWLGGHWASKALTLHNEVDPRRLGVIVRLHGAGVGALVVHVHTLYLDSVLRFGVGVKLHPRVQAPLVVASVKNGTPVEPSYSGHSVIHNAPALRKRKGAEIGFIQREGFPGVLS